MLTWLASSIENEQSSSGSVIGRACARTREGEVERVEQPLPAERHRRIQELLGERQVVRVSTLSELLGVSEVTIRRDLEAL